MLLLVDSGARTESENSVVAAACADDDVVVVVVAVVDVTVTAATRPMIVGIKEIMSSLVFPAHSVSLRVVVSCLTSVELFIRLSFDADNDEKEDNAGVAIVVVVVVFVI